MNRQTVVSVRTSLGHVLTLAVQSGLYVRTVQMPNREPMACRVAEKIARALISEYDEGCNEGRYTLVEIDDHAVAELRG